MSPKFTNGQGCSSVVICKSSVKVILDIGVTFIANIYLALETFPTSASATKRVLVVIRWLEDVLNYKQNNGILNVIFVCL